MLIDVLYMRIATGVVEPDRQHSPAEPHGRGEHRRRRADVRDLLRCEPLERTGRVAVVAEEPVVVVLDHEPIAGGRPLDELPPPLR